MGRTVKDPNRRLPKPVQKVWLSEKNVGRRILLVVLLLAIGSGFLVYGFMNFLHGDSGWREISVKAGADLNCGEDFTLKYNVGASGVSAGGEAKALSLLYTDAAVKGYRLFNIDESFEDVTNLYDIIRVLCKGSNCCRFFCCRIVPVRIKLRCSRIIIAGAEIFQGRIQRSQINFPAIGIGYFFQCIV